MQPISVPQFSLSLALVLAASLGAAGSAAAARGEATRSLVYGQHGMVCAAQPLAVQAGLEILQAGRQRRRRRDRRQRLPRA